MSINCQQKCVILQHDNAWSALPKANPWNVCNGMQGTAWPTKCTRSCTIGFPFILIAWTAAVDRRGTLGSSDDVSCRFRVADTLAGQDNAQPIVDLCCQVGLDEVWVTCSSRLSAGNIYLTHPYGCVTGARLISLWIAQLVFRWRGSEWILFAWVARDVRESDMCLPPMVGDASTWQQLNSLN